MKVERTCRSGPQAQALGSGTPMRSEVHATRLRPTVLLVIFAGVGCRVSSALFRMGSGR